MIPLQGIISPDGYNNGLLSPLEQTFGEYAEELMFVGICILVLLIIRVILKRQLLNHWSILLKGLSYSPEEFYQRLKKELENEGVKGLTMRQDIRSEGSTYLSSKRYYSKISWNGYSYSVCAAPFSNSFFVSYRSLVKRSIGQLLISMIPFIGRLIIRVFFRVSWYKEDTIIMFHTLIHESIVKVINEITDEKGIERMNEQQKIPKMRDIFNR